MKTRNKKCSNAVNTSANTEKGKRKPLSDKTNNANTSNNMKRKKQPTRVPNKIGTKQTRRNSVKNRVNSEQNANKSVASLNLIKNTEIGKYPTVLTSKNEPKIDNKSDVKNEPKIDNKSNVKNVSIKHDNGVKKKTIITRRSSRISETQISEYNKIPPKLNTNKEEKKDTTKNKRLLNCLKSPSSENSDPYEFKFDPKTEEPKRKPKKKGRTKKFQSSDTSDEEDNSMKRIVKNIRKKVARKREIPVTPVERLLRNRLVKIDHQTQLNAMKNSVKPGIETNITSKNDITSKNTSTANVINEITNIFQVNDTKNSVIPEIVTNITSKNAITSKITSAADEINEIANTFLEDDDSNDSCISNTNRIDIISNLIARKTATKRSSVFNSTMINETATQMAPRSPWRVDVSTIARTSHHSLNFSTKNTSFYTPDLTNHKKQTTLLDFVNRTPNRNLQTTLFQNSPTRKPFENLSNSVSPIRSNISPVKRGDNSLFGFSVLSDSEDKENSPVFNQIANKRILKRPEKKPSQFDEINAPVCDISIPLFEDLQDVSKHPEKRFSRQYTRTKRKRIVSFNICSDESESETETRPVKKKQKDVFTKEEAEEAERLASHYNSYFEEIENDSLCIE